MLVRLKRMLTRAPLDPAPDALMDEIQGCAGKVRGDHEANGRVPPVCNKKNHDCVGEQNNRPEGNRFYQRSFGPNVCSHSIIVGQGLGLTLRRNNLSAAFRCRVENPRSSRIVTNRRLQARSGKRAHELRGPTPQ